MRGSCVWHSARRIVREAMAGTLAFSHRLGRWTPATLIRLSKGMTIAQPASEIRKGLRTRDTGRYLQGAAEHANHGHRVCA